MPWSTVPIRYAVRSSLRQPLTSCLAVAVMALGIASATVTSSAVEAVILRALPFPFADRLIVITQTTRAHRVPLRGATNSRFSFEQVAATRGDLFDDVAGYQQRRPALIDAAGAVRLRAAHASSNLFPLLGVAPLIGQTFGAEDDRTGGEPRVLLGYGFWMSRYGGDPRVLGRTLVLDGQPATIVGVLPRGFDFPRDIDLWRTIGSLPPEPAGRAPNPQGGYRIVGRLRAGVTIDAAQAALDARWDAIGRAHSAYDGWVPNLSALRAHEIGTAGRSLWLLFGAALLVLAVACANVANLLLVRASARRGEVAVRLALGATRRRIVSQALTESLLLAAAGGLAGVLLSHWAITLLATLTIGDVPALIGVALNRTVLVLALIATGATGLFAGLVPGLWAARQSSVGVAPAGVTRWKTPLGELSLVGQVALTMTLMAAAGLVTVSLARALRVDTGYNAHGIVSAQLTLPSPPRATVAAASSEDDRRAHPALAFADRLVERLRARGELSGAAVGTGSPFASGVIGSVRVDDAPEREGGPDTLIAAVTADYFGVLQIPLRRGRMLRFAGGGAEAPNTEAPNTEAPDTEAVLINDALARAFFPGQDPLGHRLTFYGAKSAVIVGIVADTREMTLTGRPMPQIYQPFTAGPESFVRVVARSRADTAAAMAALREVLREVAPDVPVDRVVTLDEMMLESVARWRLVTMLLGLFAAVALAMSAAGVYGLAAHHVERRQREMGIRLALGAAPGRLLRLVFGRGLLLTAAGLLTGLGGALLTGRLLSAFLFELSPRDPLVLGGVAATLALVTLLACALPARRASRIDPARLLRQE